MIGQKNVPVSPEVSGQWALGALRHEAPDEHVVEPGPRLREPPLRRPERAQGRRRHHRDAEVPARTTGSPGRRDRRRRSRRARARRPPGACCRGKLVAWRFPTIAVWPSSRRIRSAWQIRRSRAHMSREYRPSPSSPEIRFLNPRGLRTSRPVVEHLDPRCHEDRVRPDLDRRAKSVLVQVGTSRSEMSRQSRPRSDVAVRRVARPLGEARNRADGELLAARRSRDRPRRSASPLARSSVVALTGRFARGTDSSFASARG